MTHDPELPSPGPPGPLTRLKHRGVNVVAILGLAASGATVAGLAGACWWPLDLASHFRVQYVGGLLVAALIMRLARRHVFAMTFVAFGVLNVLLILPQYRKSADTPPAAGPDCRFMELNVRTENTRHERIVAEIRDWDPDVLVLQEVDDRWLDALTGVTDAYPHAFAEPRGGNFGIAIFSRHPMDARAIFIADSVRVPSILARLTVDGTPITVIATHPPPPSSARGSRQRDRQLAALGDLVSDLDGPLVVIGDLNATPWSAPMRSLLAETGLTDASRGRGVHATWPAGMPLLLIPIDHCLHSPEIEIVDEQVGGFVGSDHYPLIVDVRLPAAPPGAPVLPKEGPGRESTRGSLGN